MNWISLVFRLALIIGNVALLALGILLLGQSLALESAYSKIVFTAPSHLPVKTISYYVGAASILMSYVGVFAIFARIKHLLLVYVGIMIVLLLLHSVLLFMVITLAKTYVNSDKAYPEDLKRIFLARSFTSINEEHNLYRVASTIQLHNECCGLKAFHTYPGMILPEACCKSSIQRGVFKSAFITNVQCTPRNAFKRACGEILVGLYQDYLGTIKLYSILSGFIEICCGVLAFFVNRHIND